MVASTPPFDAPRRSHSGIGLLLGLVLILGGCGGSTSSKSGTGASVTSAHASSVATATPSSPPSTTLAVLPAATLQGNVTWTPVVSIGARTAAWLARVPGDGAPITMLRFQQPLLRLALHSGSMDPGGTGWQYGAAIGPVERHKVIAGFQGGFKLTDNVGGFLSQGRLAHPLSPGRASIVTYASGQSDIGAWKSEVPASGLTVFSVRQNLNPLIDHGQPARNLDSCVIACWGPTLGGGLASARGALGIDSYGRLIYAGGERLTVRALANALVGAGAERAAELDINPEWVNLYLYRHQPGANALSAIPMIPGQPGVPGQLFTPYNRDFFTVVTR